MAPINLLIKKSENSGVSGSTRTLILRGTLLVLTGYIILAAGFLGWSVYSSFKKQQVSEDLTKLSSQVAGFAKEEILVRRIDDRSQLVSQILKNRAPLPQMAHIVADSTLKLKGWDITPSAQQIAVVASSSQEVHDFVDELKNKYSQVELVSLVFRAKDGWIGTIAVGGIVL